MSFRLGATACLASHHMLEAAYFKPGRRLVWLPWQLALLPLPNTAVLAALSNNDSSTVLVLCQALSLQGLAGSSKPWGTVASAVRVALLFLGFGLANAI